MYITVQNDEKLKKTLKEIFTDDFMKTYTNFQTFAHFKYSSTVICNWEAEKMIYDEDLLTLFVKESTAFKNFDEMAKKAADIRFTRTEEEKENEQTIE